MKLLVMAAVGVFALSAYAQNEVPPSHTTEPVTYQAAHCPDGYQLQRWENHDMSLSINAIAIYKPSGYYPVPDASYEVVQHPDKCVKIKPIYGVGEEGRITTGISVPNVVPGSIWAPLDTRSSSEMIVSKGQLVVSLGDGTTQVILVDEHTMIKFVPSK